MSAHFFVTFRGQPVRFTYQAGKRIYEIVERDQATPFCSEPDAWHAACQHQLSPQFVAVENRNAQPKDTERTEVAA